MEILEGFERIRKIAAVLIRTTLIVSVLKKGHSTAEPNERRHFEPNFGSLEVRSAFYYQGIRCFLGSNDLPILV